MEHTYGAPMQTVCIVWVSVPVQYVCMHAKIQSQKQEKRGEKAAAVIGRVANTFKLCILATRMLLR